MEKKVIGIDVSKAWFDTAFKKESGYEEKRFENTQKGIKSFISLAKRRKCRVILEHTGHYGLLLCCMLQEAEVEYAVIPAIQIKRSVGLVRGKSDLIDARRIAEFGYTHFHKIKPSRFPSKSLLKLKDALTYRDQLIRINTSLKNSLKAHQMVTDISECNWIVNDIKQQIVEQTKRVEATEQQIKSIIREDPELEKNYNLLTSIKGVGLLIAAFMLVSTSNFTSFANGRKFACYAGIAPFEYSSGSSISGKTRVSFYGNKRIKSLLFTGSNSAVNYDPEMRAYYLRKKEEGKNHQQIINAICCKLVNRAFAVIKRGTPYVQIYGNNFTKQLG